LKHHARFLTLALAALLLVSAPAAAHAAKAKKVSVSLGDSLAVGVQPKAGGGNRNTGDGYANQLAKLAGTKLVNFGCGGATSESIYSGKKACSPTLKTPYKNKSAKTSQLAAAEKYLKANRKKVAFVTIDIGANDVATCAQGGKLDVPCVTEGLARLKKNTPLIAKRLRKAAGKNVTLVGMTFYNPFLQSWFTNPGLAEATVKIAKDQFNTELVKAYRKQGFKIADVATAFGTYRPFSQTTTYAGRAGVPVAVANICKNTWMCSAARGPDIHANKAGYTLIAKTFQTAIGKKARR
jgi:lysophospholipase L1-like esterase